MSDRTSPASAVASAAGSNIFGRYECNECEFVANNRKQLASHQALSHSDRVYQCTLCNFVTRYQANFYRHRRTIHGLNMANVCEMCNELCASQDDLVQHTSQHHPQQLDMLLRRIEAKYNRYHKRSVNGHPEESGEAAPQRGAVEEFLQQSMMEDDANGAGSMLMYEDTPNDDGFDGEDNGIVSAAHRLNGGGGGGAASKRPLEDDSAQMGMAHNKRARVLRNQQCRDCPFNCKEAREYLVHRRDVHGERMTIFDCPFCPYASKHQQKLFRHINAMHTGEPGSAAAGASNPTPPQTPDLSRIATHPPNVKISPVVVKTPRLPLSVEDGLMGPPPPMGAAMMHPQMGMVPVAPPQPQLDAWFRCKQCHFKARNLRTVHDHERFAHPHPGSFRCPQCTFVCEDLVRYQSHMKYHALDKFQCQLCVFGTVYKWNMDRHMKYHSRDGQLVCIRCGYATTQGKPSLRAHVKAHHQDAQVWLELDGENELLPPAVEQYEVQKAAALVAQPRSLQALGAPMMGGPCQQPPGPDAQKRSFKCSHCPYRSYWPVDIKKHEITHFSPTKKHQCPLCELRFDHIDHLGTHLSDTHPDHKQAKNIIDVLKMITKDEAAGKAGTALASISQLPASTSLLPQVQSISPSITVTPVPPPQSASGTSSGSQPIVIELGSGTSAKKLLESMTASGLTVTPIPSTASTLSPKATPPLSSSSTSMSAPSPQSAESVRGVLSAATPKTGSGGGGASTSRQQTAVRSQSSFRCRFCPYETRWQSELKRHEQGVHDPERPYGCQYCDYRTKWKGDVTKHMARKHADLATGGSLSGSGATTPNGSQSGDEAGVLRSLLQMNASAAGLQQNPGESPLLYKSLSSGELSISVSSSSPQDKAAVDGNHQQVSPLNDLMKMTPANFAGPASAKIKAAAAIAAQQQQAQKAAAASAAAAAPNIVKKYRCPHCSFETRGPSRFHVHMIQHLNCKPFVCSGCQYRSNWQWDVNKHIRSRSSDPDHKSAEVIIADESGTKDFERYKAYIVEEPASKASVSGAASDTVLAPVSTPEPESNQAEEEYDDLMDEELTKSPQSQSMRHVLYCGHCRYSHADRRILITHLGTHAGISSYHCRLCEFTSKWYHIALMHVRHKHNAGSAQVRNRVAFVESGNTLTLRDKLPPPVQQPNIPAAQQFPAQKVPDALDDLGEDDDSQEGEGENGANLPYACDICPYRAGKLRHLEYHQGQHIKQPDTPFKCPYCPFWVRKKKSLGRHLRCHRDSLQERIIGGDDAASLSEESREYLHKCEHCPYQSDNLTQFLYHKQFHRPNKAAQHRCDHCSYWSTHAHLITQHMRVHTEQMRQPTNTGATKKKQPRLTVAELFSNAMQEGRPLVPNPELPENAATSRGIPIVTVVQSDGVRKSMFKCRYCPLMNKRRANVVYHERMHNHTTGRFPCTMCNYRTDSYGVLASHMKVHLGQHKGAENIESIEFVDENAVPDSFDDDDDEEGGEHCDSIESELYYLLNGGMEKVKSKPVSSPSFHPSEVQTGVRNIFSYFCANCPAMFKSQADLETHAQYHFVDLPHKCSMCTYAALHKPHLIKHLNVHTPEYAERKSGRTLHDIRMDKVRVEDPPSSSDPQLAAEELDTRRIATGQTTNDLVHKCNKCPAQFKEEAVFAFHGTLHGSKAQYACTFCDYAADCSGNVSVHTVLHYRIGGREVSRRYGSAEKKELPRHFCDRCPASFLKIFDLETHKERHGANLAYICPDCDYSGATLAVISRHRSVHQSPYKKKKALAAKNNAAARQPPSYASLARGDEGMQLLLDSVTKAQVLSTNRSELQLSNIKRLSELREEKKIFLCPACPYSNHRKDNLIHHMKRHSTQAKGLCLKCSFCSYATNTPTVLKDHVKLHFTARKVSRPQAFSLVYDMEIIEVVRDEEGNELEDQEVVIFRDSGPDVKEKRYFPKLRFAEERDNTPLFEWPSREEEKQWLIINQEVSLVLRDVVMMVSGEKKDDSYYTRSSAQVIDESSQDVDISENEAPETGDEQENCVQQDVKEENSDGPETSQGNSNSNDASAVGEFIDVSCEPHEAKSSTDKPESQAGDDSAHDIADDESLHLQLDESMTEVLEPNEVSSAVSAPENVESVDDSEIRSNIDDIIPRHDEEADTPMEINGNSGGDLALEDVLETYQTPEEYLMEAMGAAEEEVVYEDSIVAVEEDELGVVSQETKEAAAVSDALNSVVDNVVEDAIASGEDVASEVMNDGIVMNCVDTLSSVEPALELYESFVKVE